MCMFTVVYSITSLINKLDTYRVRKIGYDEMFIMVSCTRDHCYNLQD